MASSLQLLSPVKIGSLSLLNRVVMAPLTRGRAGTSRLANEYIAEYFAMRASAGLLITDATAISPQGYGWYGSPALYTKEQAEGWKLTTDAVHAKGGVIFAQLWHMGRQAHSSFNDGAQIVAPSAIRIPGEGTIRDCNQNSVPYETPRALETDEIADVVKDYQRSAQLAKDAGFDGVELHGANGYLIDTFLQASSNQRTDRYGGSIENCVRFLIEVVDAVKEVFPADRIGLRISPNGVFGDMGSADSVERFSYVAAEMDKKKIAYLHVMDGLGFGFHGKCRAVTLHDIKKNFSGPVIGNIAYTRDTAEGVIRSGAADLVAFGRAYITNPDLVERFRNNLPLAPDAPYNEWYGRTADPKDSLEGFLSYGPHEESKQNK